MIEKTVKVTFALGRQFYISLQVCQSPQLSECANTSNHCYLTHELRLRLKEEALGVCPNYLLQHCHPQHLPLHQHHLLRRRPRRRRSPLEQLPRGARRPVAGRSLKSSKLKQWTFLSFFSASVIYCLYFCVVVWIWVCGVMCLSYVKYTSESLVFLLCLCERVCVVLPCSPPAGAPPGGGP